MKKLDEIINKHAEILKLKQRDYMTIDDCEDVINNAINEAINYTRCCE